MIKIISKRTRRFDTSYEVFFGTGPGAGFGFECDENGNIFFDRLSKIGKSSYKDCIEAGYPKSIQKFKSEYVDPAVGLCECGHEVVLYDALTNECEHCGRLYNMCGQELAPEASWEEKWDEEGY